MNREIKFRGQHILDGGWLYGYFVGPRYNSDKVYITGGGPYGCIEVKPETVGEYTGLRDINGENVYEGDITKDGTIIMFHNNAFQECYLSNGKVQQALPLWLRDEHNLREKTFWIEPLEIAGNIHDNPELLKSNSEI